jgi:hypothetical protein
LTEAKIEDITINCKGNPFTYSGSVSWIAPNGGEDFETQAICIALAGFMAEIIYEEPDISLKDTIENVICYMAECSYSDWKQITEAFKEDAEDEAIYNDLKELITLVYEALTQEEIWLLVLKNAKLIKKRGG